MLGRAASQGVALAVFGLVAWAGPGAAADSAGEAPADAVGPVLWKPAVNVFRRFEGDAEPMYDFYGEVLGLNQLSTLNPDGSGGVARFQVGPTAMSAQIKLTPRTEGETYQPGGVRNATGLRLLTLYFPDEAALKERFEAHGLETPEFQSLPTANRKAAVVTDPEGHAVQLIVAPDASEETYARLEVGLTVSDMEESRRFYREFVGLEEKRVEEDPVFDTRTYAYPHGSTTINLRHFGDDLPKDTGTGGIQYVVSNIDVVDRLAKARDITIEQPLNKLEGFDLRTIWLEDPDGITNYFAETGQSRQAQSASAAQ